MLGFKNACQIAPSLAIQQVFSKPCLVNLISKDTHLVFSIYKDSHLWYLCAVISLREREKEREREREMVALLLLYSWIFLSHPDTNNWLFFLLTIVFLFQGKISDNLIWCAKIVYDLWGVPWSYSHFLWNGILKLCCLLTCFTFVVYEIILPCNFSTNIYFSAFPLMLQTVTHWLEEHLNM